MDKEVIKYAEIKKPLDPHASAAGEVSGVVTKFLYNPHGDSDGLLLDGDKQIHFAPHLSAEVLKSMKVGDKIHVHGKKIDTVGLTIAASITLDGGTKIVDNGPPEKPHKY